jgi:hypothetical protein
MATHRPRRADPNLTEQARRAGIRLVRFLYTDNGGITRGKPRSSTVVPGAERRRGRGRRPCRERAFRQSGPFDDGSRVAALWLDKA